MTLQILMEEIEETVGRFSESYKTIDEHHHKGHVHSIPFELKPAQQCLAKLGVVHDQHAALSILTAIHSAINCQDVTVKSFSPKDSIELIITAERIQRLLQSAKIYVNTDLCPAGLYAKAMQQHLVNRKDSTLSEDANIHWQNLAVGVCLAQEIDLLIDTSISSSGRALTTARKGTIAKDAPAILLLSNPALKFKHGLAKKLDKETRNKFVEGMYRNIFNAAVNNGRNYIALPAGGLGKSGGKPEVYFAALMTVAKEFPGLNIIYNPGKHVKKFDEALHKAKLNNVVKTGKNVVFIADKLIRQGKSCALFSTPESDVIYGHSDVGDCWKLDKNTHFDGENYLGVASTAALNSHGLNPHAWEHIIERSLTAPSVVQSPEKPATPRKNPDNKSAEHPPVTSIETGTASPDTNKPLPKPEGNSTPRNHPQPEPIIPETQHTPHIELSEEIPIPSPNKVDSMEVNNPELHTQPEIPIEEGNLSSSKSALDKILETKSGSSLGLFKPDSVNHKEIEGSEHSHFNPEQIDAIRTVISGLQREIDSCWPYPKKDLKQIKVEALEALIIEAQTRPIEESIKAIKKTYPRVTEGSFSTRTADLFDRLVQEARGVELTG